jgi:hypothetical protein
MVKKLLTLILVINSYFTYAETIKTDVLVIGNGVSAVTAALQCAHSKVKTILLVKGGWLEDMQSQKMMEINSSYNLPSGLWGQFRTAVREFYKNRPSLDTFYRVPLAFEPYTGAAILKKIADTTKNLTLKLNTNYTSIAKNGTGWEVTIIANGQTDHIKARIIVDGTAVGEIVTKIKSSFQKFTSLEANRGSLYRTSIAVGDYYKNGGSLEEKFFIPMQTFIVNGEDNLLTTDRGFVFDGNFKNLPMQMNIGQGVGTIAAFCAFFKTTTQNLKVRLIQGELLDFKGYLLPFEDIEPSDREYRAVQQIAATGLLKGKYIGGRDRLEFNFMPDSVVNTAEIKPILTEIYSRAFIWFNNEKPGEQFTVGNLLSFISEITLTDREQFRITMQKEWKTKYKFNTEFDLNHPVTRIEFAVLANQFLNPFARTVDLNGRMIN